MTVIYVDSVFVLNALMDALLLLATSHLAGVPPKRWRILLAALLGGCYAVAVFLPGGGVLAGWSGKLVAGGLMAAIAFVGERRLLRLILLLFAVSCGFAGCVLGLGFLAGGGVPMARGIFYTDINAKVLLIAAGAAYLAMSVVFRASARHGVNGMLIPVKIFLEGRAVSLKALCDTGNALRDPSTGRTVLVTSARYLEDLWPPEIRQLLSRECLQNPADVLERLNRRELRFRLIPYRAVGVSGGLLLAFRSDWCEIHGRRYDRLLVALSPTDLGDGFSALWGDAEGGKPRDKLDHSGAAASGGLGNSAAENIVLYRWQRHSAGAAAPGQRGGTAESYQ